MFSGDSLQEMLHNDKEVIRIQKDNEEISITEKMKSNCWNEVPYFSFSSFPLFKQLVKKNKWKFHMVPRKFVYKYHYLLITCLPVAMEQLEAVAVFRD